MPGASPRLPLGGSGSRRGPGRAGRAPAAARAPRPAGTAPAPAPPARSPLCGSPAPLRAPLRSPGTARSRGASPARPGLLRWVRPPRGLGGRWGGRKGGNGGLGVRPAARLGVPAPGCAPRYRRAGPSPSPLPATPPRCPGASPLAPRRPHPGPGGCHGNAGYRACPHPTVAWLPAPRAGEGMPPPATTAGRAGHGRCCAGLGEPGDPGEIPSSGGIPGSRGEPGDPALAALGSALAPVVPCCSNTARKQPSAQPGKAYGGREEGKSSASLGVCN